VFVAFYITAYNVVIKVRYSYKELTTPKSGNERDSSPSPTVLDAYNVSGSYGDYY